MRLALVDLALVVAGVGALVMSAPAVAAAPPNCTGSGYGDAWKTLRCAGTCPDQTACPRTPAGSGWNEALGFYTYCACPNEGESPCCHLVRATPLFEPLITVSGNCQLPGCPTDPLCRRTGMGTLEIPWKAECLPAE